MPVRAVIFDLDGTLLDSTNVWHKIDEIFLGKRGLEVTPDYVPAISSMNLAQAAVYTKARFGFPESEPEIIAEWHGMAEEEYALRIPMKPGAADLLRDFTSRGFPIALATASDPAYYIPALKRCGVYDLFTVFVHSMPGLLKGNAAFYLHCAKKLGVAPEDCAVFEDVLAGVRSAKDAGMLSIAVEDPGTAADRAVIQMEADYYISSFIEAVKDPVFRSFFQ